MCSALESMNFDRLAAASFSSIKFHKETFQGSPEQLLFHVSMRSFLLILKSINFIIIMHY